MRARPNLAPEDRLTPREKQVLDLLRCGLTIGAMAEQLGLRPGTVKNHLKWVRFKLNASREELLRLP